MKFDQYIANSILKDIEDEIPHEMACESYGIGYSTFRRWLDLGKIDQAEGKDTIYSQFLAAVRKVQKVKVKDHLLNIKSSEKGHKGSEWTLERAYWKHFSAKVGEIELNDRVSELEQKRGLDNVVEAKAVASEAGEDGEEGPSDETFNPS